MMLVKAVKQTIQFRQLGMGVPAVGCLGETDWAQP